MKKKFLTVLIIGILCISMVACNQSTAENSVKAKDDTKKTEAVVETVAENNVDAKFEDIGVQFSTTDNWKNKAKNIDMYSTLPEENIVGKIVISFILYETMDKGFKMQKDSEKIPKTDKVAIKKASAELYALLDEYKEICTIVTIDKSKPEDKIQKSLFSKYENKDLIGTEGNFEFYLLYNNKPDTNGISERSKKDYEEAFGEIKNFKSLIKTFTPISKKEQLSKNKLEFKTKTLEGKEIDSSIFKDSKLTMINIWATFCNPCIEEMPDLQKLYEELKSEDINMIGIVSDTPDEDLEELARTIVSKKGVKYINIIPDDSITNNILKNIAVVPTTVFVDSEGNMIGESVEGSKSIKEYKKAIQDRLKSIK